MKTKKKKKKLLKNTRSMTSLTDIVGKAIVCSLLDLFNFMIYFQRCMQGLKKGRERESLKKGRKKTPYTDFSLISS